LRLSANLGRHAILVRVWNELDTVHEVRGLIEVINNSFDDLTFTSKVTWAGDKDVQKLDTHA
jgi:hypothetical protein